MARRGTTRLRPGRRRPDIAATIAWASSLAAHCALVLWGATLVLDRPVPPSRLSSQVASPVGSIEVELVPLQAPPAEALLPDPSDPALSFAMRGGERTARPDVGVAGRGGAREVTLPAVNLAPRDDGAHLTRALRSRLERAQEARHGQGQERQAPEDDTVTPAPTILTFFADGGGQRRLPQRFASPRRPTMPSAGQWRAGAARRLGAGSGRGSRSPFGDLRRLPGDGRAGNADRLAPGPGAQDGRQSYTVIHDVDLRRAEPMALPGRRAHRSNTRGPASDDVTSEQEISQLDRALLAASTAGGEPGTASGGELGPGEPGSGGLRGRGSVSRPFGDGQGPGIAIDPGDARRRRYLRRLSSRLQSSWDASAFPKQAALEGRGGTTIVGFVVGADGSVSGVATLRPSGFPEFDARMRAAVRRAAPFGTPPSDLRAPFRHHHAFVVTNPAVRPYRPE